MARDEMMTGPTGELVKCYRRRAANVQAGDYLPEHAAYVTGDALTDPEDGSHWVTMSTGQDVRFTPRGKVWLWRQYSAPVWMTQALEQYRDDRRAWEAGAESGRIVASGAVAGASGAQVAAYNLEPADYRAAYPAPRLADYIREAAAAWREES